MNDPNPRDSVALEEIRRVSIATRVLRAAVASFVRNGTADQAAALAFFSILSLVPLTAVSSLLLRAFFGGDRALAEALGELLPYESPRFLESLRTLANHAHAVSSIGLLAFLFVAFRAYLRVESSLNRVWRVRRSRHPATRTITFLSMIFWGPVLLGILFNLRVALRAAPAWRELERFGATGPMTFFVLTALAFTMIHWKGPNARVHFVPALVGGMAAAAGVRLLRVLLTRPWGFLRQLDAIYGALAALVLFLIALQLFWSWFLFTVELVHAWQRAGRLSPRRLGELPPPEEDGALAIRLARSVVLATRAGDPPKTTAIWADDLEVPVDDLERVFTALDEAGILEEDRASRGLRPARDPALVTLDQVFDAAGRTVSPDGPAGAELREADEAKRQVLAGRRLFEAGE